MTPTDATEPKAAVSRTRLLAWSLYGVMAATALVITILNITTTKHLQHVESTWGDYALKEEARGYYLSEIRAAFGYGGLIHNFKNYVLRRDPGLAEAIDRDLSRLNFAIDQYRSITADQTELAALDQIAAVSKRYGEQIVIARELVSQGASPEDVDRRVRVDDTPALTALNVLEINWSAARNRIAEASTESLSNGRSSLLAASASLGGVFLLGAGLFFLLRREGVERMRIVRTMRRIKGALEEQLERRRQAERDLLNKSNAVDALSEGILITDPTQPDNPITFVNPAFERITGYAAEEVIGMNCRFLQGDDRNQEAVKEIREALRDARPVSVIVRNYRKDGQLFYNSLHIAPAFDDQDRLVSFVGVIHDVTERMEMQKALRESERRLLAILDNLVDGIVTMDLEGRIESFSASAERIFGYSKEEVVGNNVSMLFSESERLRPDGYIRSCQRGELTAVYAVGPREVEGLAKDGRIIPLELAVSEIKAGNRRRFVGSVRDITRRKMTEEQLVQAQKVEAIGQLTGGLAHDFNNLLTAVIGNLELLERLYGEDEKAGRWIATALSAARTGCQLTNRLLAFARRQTLEPEIVDLNALVVEFEDLLRHTPGRNIDVRIDLADPPLPVLIDRDQLETALLNLVINSRDAMPDGGTLTIRTSFRELGAGDLVEIRDAVPGIYAAISVADTGHGIPEDVKDRVFDPFFTTKEVGKGTGLGLSMVYGFVRQSNGFIQVLSSKGKGTEFTLYLPKVTDLTRHGLEPRADRQSTSADKRFLAGERVVKSSS